MSTATSSVAAGSSSAGTSSVDVVVVGAGFSGMYLLHRLRGLGVTSVVLESGDDVGGTWYWNRYPGARCDIPTTDYTYSFDASLDEWQWSEKYATQPEILRYAQWVTDRLGIRDGIRFRTKVVQAVWDDAASRWNVSTDRGDTISCRYYVMATGCLSLPKEIDIPGADRFAGPTYSTGRWPHDGVDFTGKRVAVIGTGSSGIQSIPLIAKQAAQLTVFQRTPNFSLPALNGPADPARIDRIQADRALYRHEAKWSRGGVPNPPTELSALASPEQVRRERFEAAWNAGTLNDMLGIFNDILVNEDANEIVAEMIREKIRSIVKDPDTAEALSPRNHPFGTKRPCLDTNYYATYNLPHVRLVDLRKTPIAKITETGIDTTDESMAFDVIVFATGFDAMTGAIVAVDITGRNGVTLKEKWEHGPTNYLGLMTTGFPNFFTITGPGSPSVLSNMMVSIEQHVDWVSDAIADLDRKGVTTIEPTETAEAGWITHVNDCADITLYPKANSWYVGANVPGKPRVILPYLGGVDTYRKACDTVVERGYLGFRLAGPSGEQCNDGVINQVQPDVQMVLDLMATMDVPAIESLSATDARAMMAAGATMRPPGPEVGQIVDGVLPGAAGDLSYRLYRPASAGPHPIVVYFHGGGWVLGDHQSDDPLCRDLCKRSDAIIVSVDYRHAPEARFPAAVDDGYAALCWVAEHATDLGGIPGKVAVAGWSAGGNVAAVAAQTAKAKGGPALCGQLLLTPVTDSDQKSGSYVANGEGYVLTASLMKWFWDHYADESDRTDVRAAPLRAADVSGLPPTMIVTGQFDPLRDEGNAYAKKLADAGVPVQHIQARGHTHTSISMVDVILSGAPIRAQMAEGIRSFFA